MTHCASTVRTGLVTGTFDSPVGRISITATDQSITEIRIHDSHEMPELPDGNSRLISHTIDLLTAYFRGDRLTFSSLPLNPANTYFQARVRNAMLAIPYGQTQTYGALARSLNSAPRAIGQACRRNPFPIIIPCHRVLPNTSELGGYDGKYNSPVKRWLLEHEHSQFI